NHISYIDIMALGALGDFRFVAKSEVRSWPLIGLIAQRLGCIFVRRSSARSLSECVAQAAESIRAGRSILVFPEGTTTEGQFTLPFHSGLFDASIRAGCPTQPVAIQYHNPKVPYIASDTLAPHIWRLLREPVIVMDVIFCDVLDQTDRHQMARQAKQAIDAAI